ncbi:hypothetical protein [Nocardia sp. NPDC049707]|uniref:hypothetical protein n=1 Tax=Nocardia sp. NPDC049707 TaxID=3154735 RepID=UPI00341D499B
MHGVTGWTASAEHFHPAAAELRMGAVPLRWVVDVGAVSRSGGFRTVESAAGAACVSPEAGGGVA